MIGASLNQYRIIASIGAGGMGEVFRTRDTRLNRDVAVKVLPKEFAMDGDRLRRFEQEAKTLAALNHPIWTKRIVRDELNRIVVLGPVLIVVVAALTALSGRQRI